MQGVDGHTAALQTFSQFNRKPDIRQLGEGIGIVAVIMALALQVVEIHIRHPLVGVRTDIENARRSAVFKQIEQQVGEQKVRQVVDYKGIFQPLRGQLAAFHKHPGVVDQHIQARETFLHLRRHLAHLFQRTEIGDQDIEGRFAAGAFHRLADFFQGGLGARQAAPVHDDMRPHAGQFECGLLADAIGGTGDEDGFTLHGMLQRVGSGKAQEAAQGNNEAQDRGPGEVAQGNHWRQL